MRKTTTATLFALMLTGSIALAGPVNADTSGSRQMPNTLMGSWNASGAMYSFFPGGVLLESDNPLSDPNFGGMGFSNGHGVWAKVKDQPYTYKVSYTKFGYDVSGKQVMQALVVGTIQLSEDGRSFSASLTANGNPLPVNQATRMTVE